VALKKIEHSHGGEPADQRAYLLTRARLLQAAEQSGHTVSVVGGDVDGRIAG